MRMYDIIHKKRMGAELTNDEIAFFITGYTNGVIPDYQASALCMAICLCGMSDRETASLTDAMMHSGDTVDLSEFGNSSVDKHSTGGVGDKTTLIVAPIVASLGGKVAKMSGRGLGHTGGTIDKLESISGFRTTMEPDEFLDIVRKVGLCVIGQSGDLAPADKKLYALRDVTATIDSIPLIASSIMSKKLAAGAHSIVLDVKCGSGAFVKNADDARELAKKMIAVGKHCGRDVRALVTNMDVPLGSCIGNSLEVKEAVEVLSGKKENDLYYICVALASNMVSMCKCISYTEAAALVVESLENGAALLKMKEWVSAQGGDASMIDDTDGLPDAKCKVPVISPFDGYITHMNTEKIGICASVLGAGRISKDDSIDLSAGIELFAKTNDQVRKGDVIAQLHTSEISKAESAISTFLGSVTIGCEPLPDQKLIYSCED